MRNRFARWGVLALMVAALAGCGDDGSNGAPGATGATGATGPAGPAGKDLTASVVAATMTVDQWQALTPTIDPASISVTIASAPVVKFKVTDGKGNPVTGLGSKIQASTATVASLANLNFTLAKLVPGTNGSPSKWVNYVMYRPPTVAEKAGTLAANTSCDSKTSPTWCGTFPAADTQGTLVDNGDGTYQYTFYRDITQAATIVNTLLDSADGLTKKADAGDLTYDPSLTHRLGIIITGAQPGTGTNTPTAAQTTNPVPLVKTFNIGFDFVPAGGTPTTTRDIVQKSSCTECHDGKGIGHWSVHSATNGVPAGRTVGRNDPRLCVTCHTDQLKYTFDAGEAPMLADGITFAGPSATDTTTPQKRSRFAIVDGRTVGNYPNMIHKMHMGEDLIKQNYHFNFAEEGLFNEKRFPQDQRNCIKCHTGTAGDANATKDGDNWKNVPSRLACGACHDGINFATGKGTTLAGATTGHVGQAQADDSKCALCHDATAIPIYHRPIVSSTHNPVVQDGVASFTYKLSSVTINASRQLVVKFQILKDGTAVKFNPYAAGAVPITGFTGGPSFYVIYATGQDGIAAPSDWNSGHGGLTLTDAWAQANGNALSAPDASNTYTLTIANTSASTRSGVTTPPYTLAVPPDAKMVTAILAGAFTQPGVSDPYTGRATGLLPGIPAMMAATGNTPDGKPNVARRVIFNESRCNNCHDRLGTKPNFHGGNYSIAMCPVCHTPIQGGSTGWSASFRVWVHGIHSAEKRTVPFTWHAVSATDNYSNIQYPGVLKNCEQCHLPGTYDFSASQYTSELIAGMLNVQAATGKLNPASATNYVFPQVGGSYAYGLKVDNTTDYGTGWSINTATGTLVAKTTQDNNLVSSPITAACSACHDSTLATSHMEANGGSFYDPRGIAVTKSEQCLLCHSAGRVADIKAMHAK